MTQIVTQIEREEMTTICLNSGHGMGFGGGSAWGGGASPGQFHGWCLFYSMDMVYSQKWLKPFSGGPGQGYGANPAAAFGGNGGGYGGGSSGFGGDQWSCAIFAFFLLH